MSYCVSVTMSSEGSIWISSVAMILAAIPNYESRIRNDLLSLA